jgi:signal transduction histidine kinase
LTGARRSGDRGDEAVDLGDDAAEGRFPTSGTIRRPSTAPRAQDAAVLGRILERVLDSLGTAVVVVNAAGYIAFANRRALTVLGRADDELLGVPVGDVLVSFDAVRRSAEELDGEDARAHTALPERPEVTIGYRASRLRLSEEQSSSGYTVSFQDITASEKVRSERDRLARLAAVSDVLPVVLDELKAPLDAIESVVALTAHEAQDEATQFELQAVLLEVRRLGLALEGVGAVGRRLESDEPTAIDVAIREVCTILSRHAQSRGVAIFTDVPPMEALCFDASVVRALVFHTVTNAIQACPDGGRVRIVARLDDASALRLRVQDDGIGMAPDVLASCREPFYSTRPNGTGMGLTVCDQAVREVGGELRIESTPGRGTTVTLVLPTSRRSGIPGALAAR